MMENNGSEITGLAALADETAVVLERLSPCHAPMVAAIREALPGIRRDTAIFGRSQSQFMDQQLTLTRPTPIRNLRQVYAEINKAMEALKFAGFTCTRRELQAQIKEERAAHVEGAMRQLLLLQAAELRSQNQSAEHYISGAVRKVRALIDQRDSLYRAIGVDNLTEEAFEADEARYHVMVAFEQALCAAYAHGGNVDEGNHIYLRQVGIAGAMGEKEIRSRMQAERALAAENKMPTPDDYYRWLNRMADQYAVFAPQAARCRGLLGEPVAAALLTRGTE